MGARQDPIPGVGGQAVITRARRKPQGERPPIRVGAGRLPLAWQTRVEPDTVLLHVFVPGDPQPWERAITTKAKLTEDGQLKQGHTFTPGATRQAEKEWQWIMRAGRRAGPVDGPVGLRATFALSHQRKVDHDNLVKLVSDAGNGILYVDDVQVNHTVVTVHRGVASPGIDLLVWRL